MMARLVVVEKVAPLRGSPTSRRRRRRRRRRVPRRSPGPLPGRWLLLPPHLLSVAPEDDGFSHPSPRFSMENDADRELNNGIPLWQGRSSAILVSDHGGPTMAEPAWMSGEWHCENCATSWAASMSRRRAGRPPRSSTRARARPSPRPRCRVPTDVGRALRAGRRRLLARGSASTPSERSLALIRIADAIEARAEELVAAECENTGKPFGLTMSEEIPPMVDQIRFFAGAARLLEGRAGGRVHGRAHLVRPA